MSWQERQKVRTTTLHTSTTRWSAHSLSLPSRFLPHSIPSLIFPKADAEKSCQTTSTRTLLVAHVGLFTQGCLLMMGHRSIGPSRWIVGPFPSEESHNNLKIETFSNFKKSSLDVETTLNLSWQLSSSGVSAASTRWHFVLCQKKTVSPLSGTTPHNLVPCNSMPCNANNKNDSSLQPAEATTHKHGPGSGEPPHFSKVPLQLQRLQQHKLQSCCCFFGSNKTTHFSALTHHPQELSANHFCTGKEQLQPHNGLQQLLPLFQHFSFQSKNVSFGNQLAECGQAQLPMQKTANDCTWSQFLCSWIFELQQVKSKNKHWRAKSNSKVNHFGLTFESTKHSKLHAQLVTIFFTIFHLCSMCDSALTLFKMHEKLSLPMHCQSKVMLSQNHADSKQLPSTLFWTNGHAMFESKVHQLVQVAKSTNWVWPSMVIQCLSKFAKRTSATQSLQIEI